jgi:hypothetical protein
VYLGRDAVKGANLPFDLSFELGSNRLGYAAHTNEKEYEDGASN